VVTSVSLEVGVGLICALLSALGTNLAFLFKLKGAVAAPDVDMRHPLRSAVDLFRSRWWSIGWAVAAVAFALHVAALTLAPISIGQAVLAGGLVFLAVLAERFFGFELGRRQWIGIGLVAVSLSLLALTAGGGSGAHSDYSLAGMIIFEGIAVGVGVLLVVSHLIERIPVQRGVLLGIAAGLGFGISDVAVKALSGDLQSGPVGLLSPWSVVIVTAAVFSFFASARSARSRRRGARGVSPRARQPHHSRALTRTTEPDLTTHIATGPRSLWESQPSVAKRDVEGFVGPRRPKVPRALTRTAVL
jgi:drug/metabolite transporter (DMT)-like permease